MVESWSRTHRCDVVRELHKEGSSVGGVLVRCIACPRQLRTCEVTARSLDIVGELQE